MLLGRDLELAQAGELLDERGIVVVTGAAGIGKSALARAVVHQRGGHRVLAGLSTLSHSPLLAFRRLLRTATLHGPEAAAAALLRDGRTPLVVDDAQWLDDASFEALGLVVGRLGLVATVRTGASGAADAVAVFELLGAGQVDLAGLDERAAAQVLDEAYPDLGSGQRQEILGAAQGNPLLLRELPLGPEASPTLTSALLPRLHDLDHASVRATQRLAILGRPATPAELGIELSPLLASGIVERVGDRVALPHALLAEVIVEDLGADANRVRADLAMQVDPAEGAYLLAAAGDRAGAHALALVAAEQAAQRRDRFAEAELLGVAAESDEHLDIDLRVRAARRLTETSQPRRTLELVAFDGRDDLEPVARGRLRGVEAEARWMLGDSAGCLALVELAVADLAGSNTVEEALVLAGSTIGNTFLELDGRPALERARAASALAVRLGEARSYTRARLASVLMTAGDPSWQEVALEAIALSREEGDEDTRRTAFVSLMMGTWATGDVRRAAALAREELALGPSVDVDLPWLTIAAYAALLGLLSGEPPDELVASYLPILEDQPLFRSRHFLEAAVIVSLADLGRHATAADLAVGAVVRAGAEAQARSVARWAQIDATWIAGQLDRAYEIAALLEADGAGDYPSAIEGRLVGAHAARELARPVIGQRPASPFPAWAPASEEWDGLALAADGRSREAAEALLGAAQRWMGSDVRAALRCRWAAGDVLAEAGDPRGVEILLAAEQTAEAEGRSAMATRIRRSLRRAGVTTRSSSERGPEGLSAREVEVLELISVGMRTAEVAVALGIEPSTVEAFVRSAMRRLDAPTRVAAVARLAELRRATLSGEPAPSTT